MKELFETVFNNFPTDIDNNDHPTKDLISVKAIQNDAKQKLIDTNLFNTVNGNFDSEKYEIKGSCGNGNWTYTPWIGIFRKTETDAAPRGIYIVYLFNKKCDKIYLTLNQGSSSIEHVYKKETINILNQTSLFWRKALTKYNNGFFVENNNIYLDDDSNSTAKAYQNGTILYKEYSKQNLPDNEIILSDLKKMLELYEKFVDIRLHLFNHDFLNSRKNYSSKIEIEKKLIKDKIDFQSFNTTFQHKFINALLSKPFTILAGNSGTGKTKIAKDLATWLGKKDENTNTIANKLIVPVGSDWTDNTKILGFYNPLKKTYESTKILDFILLAHDNPEIPFFLILDEMNLSHVERYFSDFLSAMESHEKIILYSKDEDCDSDIPESIDLPENLFVTGTVNIDETTYMFSPKVLDRANVIEFIPAQSDVLANFAAETQPIEIEPVNDGSAEGFLALAKTVRETTTLPAGSDICKTILEGISNILDGSGFEFAFRTAKEIRLYINAAYALAQNEGKTLSEEDYVNLMDEQLLQKILPKVHGNRKQIGSLLEKMESFCTEKSLSLSLAKVQKMKVRLENYQYASFI